MNCRPLFVGKNTIGDRYDNGAIFVFFGNKTFTDREFSRLFPERHLKFLKQVHGSAVHTVDENFVSGSLPGDAMITNVLDVSPAIYTADCLPILIHDPITHEVAAVHAGWRGLVNKTIIHTLLEMNIPEPEKVQVWIGPHIHRKSFEVHNDVANELLLSNLGTEQVIFEHESDPAKKCVDLSLLAKSQLISRGIRNENIWLHPIDTYADTNYFSYRRDGPTGRLISFITLID